MFSTLVQAPQSAVRIVSAGPYINLCTIRDTAGRGVSVSGRTANLKLTSSLITRNIVENRPPGAGLRAVGGTVTLIGNTISDNEAGEEGGGLS